MSNKRVISYGVIFKRSRCLNSSITESVNVDKRYDKLKLQIENMTDGSVNPSVKKSVSEFMESIYNKDANKYYRYPLSLIEKFNCIDTNISNTILENYVSLVLPYVEDLSDIKETVDGYYLLNNQREKILETACQYNIADRILKNHDRISKRFNIQSEATKVRSKGLKNVVESCCDMIDTYNIKPYQKLNLCIEELNYLFGKNNIEYDKKDLVSYVTEYFVLQYPNLSDNDIIGYRKALSENACLSEEDLEKVQYIYQDDNDCENVGNTSIKKEIDKFLRCQVKDAGKLEICVKNSLNNNTKEDIIANFDKLLYLIFDVQKSGICDQEEYFDMNTEGFCNELVRVVQDSISIVSDNCFTSKDIERLICSIEKIDSIIFTRYNDDDKYRSVVSIFKTNLSKLKNKLLELQRLVYSESNLSAINFVNSYSDKVLPLNEFKLFKFNNLVTAAINLDKFLKDKAKKVHKKGAEKINKAIKKAKNILFNESKDIYSYISEDSKLDICVAQYPITESDLEDIVEFVDEACKDYNDTLNISGNYTSKAYYIVNPGILEVRLKDCTTIGLDEYDMKSVHESYSSELDVYVEEFATMQTVIESLNNFCLNNELESVQEKLLDFVENSNLTIDHYRAIMEALSLLDVTKEEVSVFSEKFSSYIYNTAVLESVITESEYNKEVLEIKEISNNWEKEDSVPIDIQWEAYQILCAILEEAPPVEKPEVKKPKIAKPKKPNLPTAKNKEVDNTNDEKDNEEDDTKDNPFKGININSIRLYLEGLKGKMKKMSQKEKEISKNLDNSFRRFVKSMKDALVSDRREAIIKGSVIPSFSRCVKIAIGLVGTGIVTGNPLVPITIAICGFAMSKKLTKQERLLLLDEIETELDVVDKEISMAESKNQMKKYRALLKYKKDLQRQYQRIRYNVRVGKDILPGSAAGINKGND